MRFRFPSSLPIFVLLCVIGGPVGCGGEQMMGHQSSQIGRYYGRGISFSVPDVPGGQARPEDPAQYWELRQDVASTPVVALSPLTGPGDAFRENVVVTLEAVPEGTTPEAFRAAQVRELEAGGDLQGPVELGQDEAGPWAGFRREVDGVTVRGVAWFFTRGTQGVAMVASAQAGGEAESYLDQFRAIAASFRFGAPPSGFALLGRAVDGVARLEGVPEPAEPSPESPTGQADSGPPVANP